MIGKSGQVNFGSDLQLMRQGAGERFKAADADSNEGVSRKEFGDFIEQAGVDAKIANKIFDRLDLDDDGQISKNEQQDVMRLVEQRLGGLKSREAVSKEGFDEVKSLIASLQNESSASDKNQRLQDAVQKIRSAGYDESIDSDSALVTNGKSPQIDTHA
jgi:hypothetical protein